MEQIRCASSYVDEVIKHMEVMRPISEVARELEKIWHTDLHQRFVLLRKMYSMYMPQIMEGRADPYLIDWLIYFTPIEKDLWQIIRSSGAEFYPQIPARQYFLDFADPIKKIGFEADGKEWHEKERDTKRDKELREDGWLIFRVTGRECFKPEYDFERLAGLDQEEVDYELQDWAMTTADGVVHAVTHRYYGTSACGLNENTIEATLNAHCLTDINLIPCAA